MTWTLIHNKHLDALVAGCSRSPDLDETLAKIQAAPKPIRNLQPYILRELGVFPRDPSTVALNVGDQVKLSVPCAGEDHEGNYHELEAGRVGTIERIETYSNEQGLAFTVVIPVDQDHAIVNVFDEQAGLIEDFLTRA